MHPTLRRWISASSPTVGARLAVLALAALGHFAVLGSLWWDRKVGLVFPLAMTAPNLLVLAAAALARRKIAWPRGGPMVAVVGASVVMMALCSAAQVLGHGAGLVLSSMLLGACSGAAFGLVGALVATPLCRVIERWRADPAPRRALDVWAALASYGVVFAVARPFQYGRSAQLCGAFPRSANCFQIEFGRLLQALDPTLAATAIVVAGAVLALDLHLRRVIARAHAGALYGHRVTAAAIATDAVSFATAPGETMLALVGPPPGASYREDASDAVVALLPKTPNTSWRLLAMPLVILLCALGLASGIRGR